MTDTGTETEFEAVRGHLFMLLTMPFIQEFEELNVVVKEMDDGEVVVYLDCDDGGSRYTLHRLRGDDALAKGLECAKYLVRNIDIQRYND